MAGRVRKVTAPGEEPTPVSEGLRLLEDITKDPTRDWSKVAERAISMRMAGSTVVEIADALFVTPRTVEGWLAKARKNAELLDIGPILDHIALPLAIDNLLNGLRAGDQKYTLSTLQGRGAFSAHSKAETNATSTALEIRIEMPARSAEIEQGQIVGVPRQLKDAVDA